MLISSLMLAGGCALPMNNPEFPVADLYVKPAGASSRWISFENPAGAKGAGAKENRGRKGHAMEKLRAGETKTLLDLSGPGTIRRIWLTVRQRDPETLRRVRIEMFWDGSQTPAVSVPLGDFFGAILGRPSAFENAFFSNPEGRSFNCSIPMPFRSGARVTATNDGAEDLSHIFYEIDATLGDRHPENALYFHAVWRRERWTKLGEDFEILPRVAGAGRFLGAHLGVILNPAYTGWWGEGEVKIYLDGDGDFPTLAGTGTEDYIGTGWGQDVYAHRHQGCLLADAEGRRYSFYRYHAPDPVWFDRDIRVTIQQMGGAEKPEVVKMLERGAKLLPVAMDTGGGEEQYLKLLEASDAPDLKDSKLPDGWVNFLREDDWSAVAFFYLDRPENGLPPIAGAEARAAHLTD